MRNLHNIFKFSNIKTNKIIFTFAQSEDDLINFFSNNFFICKNYCIKYNFDFILITKKIDSRLTWDLQKELCHNLFIIMGYNQFVYIEINSIFESDISFSFDNFQIDK